MDRKERIAIAQRVRLLAKARGLSFSERVAVETEARRTGVVPAALTSVLTAPRVETIKYKNSTEFDADAVTRLAGGWQLLNVSDPAKGRVSVTRAVVFAPAALTGWRKGKGRVTAVWSR